MRLTDTIVEQILSATPAMTFLSGKKKKQVVSMIANDYDFGQISTGFVYSMQQSDKSKMDTGLLLHFAEMISAKAPINANPEKIVFFSGDAQPDAEAFVNANPDYDVIHTTLPGALLEMYTLFDSNFGFAREQRYEPWNVLSRRLALTARDNTHVFLNTAKPTATFINQEMPIFLLENKDLLTIQPLKGPAANTRIAKGNFWDGLPIQGLENEGLTVFKSKILAEFNPL